MTITIYTRMVDPTTQAYIKYLEDALHAVLLADNTDSTNAIACEAMKEIAKYNDNYKQKD